MIISPGRNYIFVHIPKTGGTALALALESRAMKDDILIGDTPKALRRRPRLKKLSPRGRLWKHATLADIDGILTPDEIAAMTTFTLVRNPWDRMVSYYHWLRAQGFDHPAVRLAGQLGFSAFLNHPQTAAALRAGPYASYMRDVTGTERCTHYIRIESFAKDSAALAPQLGFAPRLERVNASARHADYRRYYSDSDARLLADLCAADIARFGYAFDATRGD